LDVGQAHVAVAGVLVRVELDLLVADHLLDDAHLAPGDLGAAEFLSRGFIHDADPAVRERGGEVVGDDLGDERLVVLVVELLHLVLLAVVLVDGLLVQHRVGGAEVELGDGAAGGLVDDDEVVPAHGPEAHVVRGVGVGAPVVAVARGVHHAVTREVVERRARVRGLHHGVRLAAQEGQLERRALEVLDQDLRVRRVDARRLHPAVQQVVRVAREVLVERRARRDHHGDAPGAPPAGAAEALPRPRDRAGVARADDRVEVAHVDAQLERVGGDDAADLALPEAPLHAAARLGEVAAAVGHDRVLDPRHLGREPVAEVLEHDLDRVARLPEDEGRHLRAHEVGGEHHGALQRARAHAELGVHDRRVEDEEPARAPRRPRLVDERDLVLGDAEEARGVLARVADRRGGREEDGIRSVEARRAPEPRDHVRDVGSEDAAVGVQLVHDHVAELLEGARPVRVVREDPGVEHVRVGHDDGAALAGGAPRVPRRVAVVDDGRDREAALREQLPEARLLVARKRLGGVEVDRARVGLARERLEHREVEAEALAARRGRGDDEVPAGPRRRVRLRLVLVEPGDPPRAQSSRERRRERVGQLDERPRARGQGVIGREAGADVAGREPAGHHGLEAGEGGPGRQGHRENTKRMAGGSPERSRAGRRSGGRDRKGAGAQGSEGSGPSNLGRHAATWTVAP
jgi:hypothetical protein